jgi:hypothetical protein
MHVINFELLSQMKFPLEEWMWDPNESKTQDFPIIDKSLDFQ